MITTHVFLNAIPCSLWKTNTEWGNSHLEIGPFVEDALAIEQRIKRGVNQENERARYTLCCNRLEAVIKTQSRVQATDSESFQTALKNFQLPFIPLSSHYIDAISLIHQKYPAQSSDIRLCATFFPVELIETHINVFSTLTNELGIANQVDIKQRIAFFRAALFFQCGVIEIQDPFYYIKEVKGRESSVLDLNQEMIDNSLLQQVMHEDERYEEEDEYVSENEGRKAYDILFEQVENAIILAKKGENGAVNFSNQPHNIITEVLNEFVYSESGKAEKPIYIRVNYTDGSQGKSFPLLCLPKRREDELQAIQQSIPLKVALLSMRHLSMDQEVDMAWFRNREVSKTRAFGETDQFCYENTKKLLEQSRAEGILKLNVYQTGLQPAVIGFYRALTEELLFRSNDSSSLEITPLFKGKSTYRQGRLWN